MPPIKKIVMWLVVVFLLYAIFTAPSEAADMFRAAWDFTQRASATSPRSSTRSSAGDVARRPRLDRELERYLVDGETVIVAVRRHWFHLFREILIALGRNGSRALGRRQGARERGRPAAAQRQPPVSSGAPPCWLLWRVLNWRHDWFVATDKRFLLFYGFIRRKVAMMPLLKVTDMTYDRSLLGRIVGYGMFVLESAGQDQALSIIDHVPDADTHYRAICTQLFGPARMLRFAPGGLPPPPPHDDDGPDDGGGGRWWSGRRPGCRWARLPPPPHRRAAARAGAAAASPISRPSPGTARSNLGGPAASATPARSPWCACPARRRRGVPALPAAPLAGDPAADAHRAARASARHPPWHGIRGASAARLRLTRRATRLH